MKRILLAKLYVGKYMGVPTYLHWTIFPVLYLLWLAQNKILLFQYCAMLGSVLIHELGHCYFARKYGMGIGSITLSPIGGMAGIEIGLPEAVSEFVVTAAGPLTSLALAIVITPAWYLSQGTPHTLFGFIMWVNICIFLFNLVPAFPLDGGRILRAFLNWKLGDVLLATRITVSVGQVMCFIMCLIGTIYGLLGLIIIGWLMLFMGPAELRVLEAEMREARQPLPKDWLAIGNDLREIFNAWCHLVGEPLLPLKVEADRAPTEEELKAWDAWVPGMSDILKGMARQEMLHRESLENQPTDV